MNKDSAVGFIVSLVLHCIIAVGVFALLSSAPKPPSMPDMIAFSIDSIMDEAKQGDISDEPNIPPPSHHSALASIFVLHYGWLTGAAFLYIGEYGV